jgi:CDP-diacylglycerol--glycerol-3-phosphate 3-phosphatidyltransferase
VASVYDLKPRFQALWRPLVRCLAQVGATANQVTVLAAILSIAVGAWLAASRGSRAALFAVPAFLFVRMALNAIDGMLAREHGQKSRLGAILNEVGDVISDAALYLPFALVAGFPPIAVVVIVVLAVVSEMTGVVGLQIGASRRYDGPMGKSDRAFVFGALSLILALGAPAGRWLEILLWAVAALLALTIVNRARRALAEVPRP